MQPLVIAKPLNYCARCLVGVTKYQWPHESNSLPMIQNISKITLLGFTFTPMKYQPGDVKIKAPPSWDMLCSLSGLVIVLIRFDSLLTFLLHANDVLASRILQIQKPVFDNFGNAALQRL
jgi:hypothetical protein